MKKTVQEIAEEMCEGWGEDNHGYSIQEILQIGFIRGTNWQAEQSPWISVDECFPENDENIFYTNHLSGALGVGVYADNHWYQSYSGEEVHGVTFWMPIPKV